MVVPSLGALHIGCHKGRLQLQHVNRLSLTLRSQLMEPQWHLAGLGSTMLDPLLYSLKLFEQPRWAGGLIPLL